jgi:hypothetical protein
LNSLFRVSAKFSRIYIHIFKDFMS